LRQRHDRPATCEITRRWRIVEADLCDRGDLDLVEPAYLQIGNDGWAEFAFAAVNASAELEYGRSAVFFRWSSFDEGDEISGDGSPNLQDDSSIEIVLSFDNGDDAVLIAPRVTSSTA
jgi:hypothetical protein